LDGESGPKSAPTFGDSNRLRQVISNLMTNVLRYTPEGTDIKIAVGTEESTPDTTASPTTHGTQSVITIRDHGPGSSAEAAEEVDLRQSRAGAAPHSHAGGSGLGLAIVADVQSQHKGSIQHEGTPGGGATMGVRLAYHPLAPDDDDEDDSAGDFSTDDP